jgi:hypothetical protein
VPKQLEETKHEELKRSGYGRGAAPTQVMPTQPRLSNVAAKPDASYQITLYSNHFRIRNVKRGQVFFIYRVEFGVFAASKQFKSESLANV